MMLGACAWETHYPCFTHSLYCNEKEGLKNTSVNMAFVNIRRCLCWDHHCRSSGLNKFVYSAEYTCEETQQL